MIIEVKANLKLNNNKLLRKGRYDDSEKPFPQEIYEEIELNKTQKRGTIEVLSGEPNPGVGTETNLLDPGADNVIVSDEPEESSLSEEEEEEKPRKRTVTRKRQTSKTKK